MSDPRVALLAQHIASVLVTLIDIAKDGETVGLTAPIYGEMSEKIVLEPKDETEERPTPSADAQPATRRRQAKSASAGDASSDLAKGTSSTTVVEETVVVEEPELEAVSVTLDDAKALVIELVQKKGRDAAIAVLGEFGAGKATALTAEQYGPFCDAAREALAA